MYDALLQDKATRDFVIGQNLADLKDIITILGKPSMGKSKLLLEYIAKYADKLQDK